MQQTIDQHKINYSVSLSQQIQGKGLDDAQIHFADKAKNNQVFSLLYSPSSLDICYYIFLIFLKCTNIHRCMLQNKFTYMLFLQIVSFIYSLLNATIFPPCLLLVHTWNLSMAFKHVYLWSANINIIIQLKFSIT